MVIDSTKHKILTHTVQVWFHWQNFIPAVLNPVWLANILVKTYCCFNIWAALTSLHITLMLVLSTVLQKTSNHRIHQTIIYKTGYKISINTNHHTKLYNVNHNFFFLSSFLYSFILSTTLVILHTHTVNTCTIFSAFYRDYIIKSVVKRYAIDSENCEFRPAISPVCKNG